MDSSECQYSQEMVEVNIQTIDDLTLVMNSLARMCDMPVSQLWYLIETWGFREDIKDIMGINDNTQ